MKIGLNSVIVNDQAKAHEFYTEKLGFVTKADVAVGDYRWLTVVSPENPDGAELLLEPNAHPAAKVFQEAIYADGIPATIIFAANVQQEYDRLSALGVSFTSAPVVAPYGSHVIFDDTCGNWIQINEG